MFASRLARSVLAAAAATETALGEEFLSRGTPGTFVGGMADAAVVAGMNYSSTFKLCIIYIGSSYSIPPAFYLH